MRLNDSKNRRMMIMEQISIRQKSREKERKSSAERRRKIEENLNDFMKTMSNVSFKHTGNSEGFRYEHPYSEMQGSYEEFQRPGLSEKHSLKQEYDEALKSPSFKDINVLKFNEAKMQVSEESIKEPHFGSVIEQEKEEEHENQQEHQQKVPEQEITFTNRGENRGELEKLTPNSIVENQSSASAIFFTSQFNEFISKNHISSKENIEGENEKQPESKQAEKGIQNESLNKNVSGSMASPKRRQSSSVSDTKFGIPNASNTSDFIPQGNQQINPVPQFLNEQERKSTLIKNKSGHSLAFSNQSSLKYSLNESNIKQILNKKFTNELIADTHQFDPSNDGSQLYHNLKLQIIADRYLEAHKKSFFEQINLLTRIVKLQKKMQKSQKRMYFDAFIIYQELIFEQKVSEIKCDKYLQEKQEQRLKNVYEKFKHQCLTLPRFKLQKASRMEQRKVKELKQKIFRCLKIAWFDQKVKKQIELYYLSKLFAHFTRVIKAQKQAARIKFLNFYCSNLKKRYFQHLKEGVRNLQTERIERDNATWHYVFRLQRKVFEGWKERLSYKDRYISLAMTTKNTFKETKDQKWLQIKTVDFKQIKYQ